LQVIISVLEGLPGRDITPFSLAVLFVFRTGVSWTDLPSCFGNWHTVYTRFKRWSENGLFLVCCTDCSKERRLKWIWFGSTAQQLACTVLGSGVLKNQNPPLGGEERAEALKIHVGLCQGILCGACLYASNKLDTSVFNELWARGNWDAIVHVVADKGYDCSSLTRSYQKTGENTRYPRRQGAIRPGVSDRERYKTRHTVERFFAHIKEHKRLFARFDKLDATFFSFFALACLNVFKVFC